MNVVLPAPFGPMRPTRRPSPTSRSTSTTACTPPKLTEIPLAFRTGVDSVCCDALHLTAEFDGGASECRAEDAAEVLRTRKAPVSCDRQDRLVPERRIGEVALAPLEPCCSDPLADARAFGLEELVEVSRRDEARTRDLLRVEARVAEVRLDVRLDGEQDLRARTQPRGRVRGTGPRVQAADEVEDALDRVRDVIRRHRPGVELRGEPRDERRGRARQAVPARDLDCRQVR